MSTSGELLFIVSAAFALGSAVATVTLANPLRAALALLVHVVALAGLFLTLNAQLLAALQLLVYAGAVVVLFVFVIMILGPAAQLRGSDRGLLVRTASFAGMAVFTAGVAFSVVKHTAPRVAVDQCAAGAACAQFGGVEALGGALYTRAVVPFELVSVTLLVAIIGALAVARGRTPAEVARARERRRALEADGAQGAGQVEVEGGR